LRVSITESRAVPVECPLLKPDWLLSRRLFCVRKEEIWMKTTRSSVFSTNVRKDAVCNFSDVLDLEWVS